MCGEKAGVHGFILLCLGSPPHVRGKEETEMKIQLNVRITPACAGKSIALPASLNSL